MVYCTSTNLGKNGENQCGILHWVAQNHSTVEGVIGVLGTMGKLLGFVAGARLSGVCNYILIDTQGEDVLFSNCATDHAILPRLGSVLRHVLWHSLSFPCL